MSPLYLLFEHKWLKLLQKALKSDLKTRLKRLKIKKFLALGAEVACWAAPSVSPPKKFLCTPLQPRGVYLCFIRHNGSKISYVVYVSHPHSNDILDVYITYLFTMYEFSQDHNSIYIQGVFFKWQFLNAYNSVIFKDNWLL